MNDPDARQHSRPLFIGNIEDDADPHPLNPIDREKPYYYENWLQNLLFDHPNAFPIEEIDSIFSPLIPVCTELPIGDGRADLLFVNPDGLLTLVECKLWRNPEARRQVVGQTLEYANELSRWSYEDLDAAIKKRRDGGAESLYKIANAFDGGLDQATFTDSVYRNLKNGRFLLLIAGDGIREGVENITNFLQKFGGLHFTFALVEFSVFQLPDEAGDGLIVQPRILARTAEIERAVIKLDHEAMSVDQPTDQVITPKGLGRRKTVTEQEFLESVRKVDSKAALKLPAFFDKCKEAGLTITITKAGGSTIDRWFDEDGKKVNFGTIARDGALNTNYICGSAEEAGDISIGEDYLKGVAKLVRNGKIVKEGNSWTWLVKKDGYRPPVSDLLESTDEWLELIMNTVEKFRSAKAGHSRGRRKTITEQEFWESVRKADSKAASALPAFFDACKQAGLTITKAEASMIVHWFDEDGKKVNFGTIIAQDGTLNTNYLCDSAKEAGDLSIGTDYLEEVAELVGNAEPRKEGNPWTWRVMKDGALPPVSDLLEPTGEWLKLIENTIEQFRSRRDL